ncbi:hypothetical protein EDD16DRAFT_1598188 [Pisolithus croceorrhizus]|nr:hypothetical protein F5141DRAFT_450501 [Pisolithus sp. B1]KAI6103153.1 hypothetical protein EV401DRAFT_2022067 [Pisolithus croceorrhizus]KAI6114587.1 hypothetical protein EDD16DRAFT_1598188 [Pisolithus croceorrhizus]KAI6135890.1 hypothetical protein EDD17DRAFT_1680895 [Pisolithus thermaeus]
MEGQAKSTSSDDPATFDRRDVDGVTERLRASLCLVFLGAPSLEKLQDMAEKDKAVWAEIKQVLTDRTNNINVVAALVVASSASYVTTTASTPHISQWNPEFPYFCVLGGFGCAMLAIVSGFAQVIFLSMMGPRDIEMAQKSRLKRICLFTLLILPLAFLLVAASSLGLAFTAALWLGDVLWIKALMTTGYAVFLFTLIVIALVLI